MPMAFPASKGVCATCAEYVQVCLACGQVPGRKQYQVDDVGPYCENCMRQRLPCDVCSAPLSDERWLLSDGRISCAHCHSTAIYTPNEAIALYDGMKIVADRLLGINLNIPTGLALVDQNQLADIIHQQSYAETLDPRQTLGIYVRKGMRRGIYVQNGLPRLVLLQVAAHEYGHAWQGENCPFLHNLMVCEGFAEWVAYKIIGYYHFNRQQKRMKKRTDIYGKGLLWALKVEAAQGISGVLSECRTVCKS